MKEIAPGEQTPTCTSHLYLLHLHILFCLAITPPHLPLSDCPSLLLFPAQALQLCPKQAGAKRPPIAISVLPLRARPYA